VHPGDLAGRFSDLEMTGSITALAPPLLRENWKPLRNVPGPFHVIGYREC